MTLLGSAVLAVVTVVFVGAPVVAPVIQRRSQLSKDGDGRRSQQLADPDTGSDIPGDIDDLIRRILDEDLEN